MIRGGKRKGAGRKPVPLEQRAVASSITMSAEEWALLDAKRGDKTRSRWLAEKVRRAKV